MTANLKIALAHFPGSNNERDWIAVFKKLYHIELKTVDYRESCLNGVSGVILPGGFSHGDYLRAGALAARSNIMSAVRDFVDKGGPVFGVCNGFQILTESGLLPGTLLPNLSDKFICKNLELATMAGKSIYHRSDVVEPTVKCTIAHGMGRYFVDKEGLSKLEDQEQIVFKYQKNPNGSVADIAGICSKDGRVLGMMPHPERAVDPVLGGGDDGKKILDSFMELCS